MLGSRQYQSLKQKQSLQQRLSPQQIQFIKLLQLPTMAFEQRVKQELEENPVIDEVDGVTDDYETLSDGNDEQVEAESLDDLDQIDWETYLHGNERESYRGGSGSGNQDWRDLPNPYHETLLESLENQVGLLKLNEREQLIVAQILGSIDSDGYFRREIQALIDSIAFNQGVKVSENEVLKVLRKIQHLDPPGIAARNLRECLLAQLELLSDDTPGRETAYDILDNEWEAFEKKHFDKIMKRLDLSEDDIKEAYECIQTLDPKPGAGHETMDETSNYIIPDFTVHYVPETGEEGGENYEEGDFIINLNDRNVPQLRISPRYKEMWDDIRRKKDRDAKETRNFIKGKIESARWFMDSIIQRQNTLMNVMRTIVALQEDFFKYGEGIKPMILKDVAERIGMDISTVSRVVNGKYVQTDHGIYELKYFFTEGVETQSGEEVSNREIKNILQELIQAENKNHPLSDQALVKELKKRGYKIARRTVSKYREQLNIPVARLRKVI